MCMYRTVNSNNEMKEIPMTHKSSWTAKALALVAVVVGVAVMTARDAVGVPGQMDDRADPTAICRLRPECMSDSDCDVRCGVGQGKCVQATARCASTAAAEVDRRYARTGGASPSLHPAAPGQFVIQEGPRLVPVAFDGAGGGSRRSLRRKAHRRTSAPPVSRCGGRAPRAFRGPGPRPPSRSRRPSRGPDFRQGRF